MSTPKKPFWSTLLRGSRKKSQQTTPADSQESLPSQASSAAFQLASATQTPSPVPGPSHTISTPQEPALSQNDTPDVPRAPPQVDLERSTPVTSGAPEALALTAGPDAIPVVSQTTTQDFDLSVAPPEQSAISATQPVTPATEEPRIWGAIASKVNLEVAINVCKIGEAIGEAIPVFGGPLKGICKGIITVLDALSVSNSPPSSCVYLYSVFRKTCRTPRWQTTF